ncbi:MAG: putative O-methyltransferase YrrM [Verrucomicrobiales bacterium]|jgi:predicted O-methyltransferase YrrM
MHSLIDNDAFHQALEAPWGRTFMALMRPAVVEELVDSTEHPFSNALPGFVRTHWKTIMDKTLVDPFRMGWLIDELMRVKDLPGNIVECGSFKGGTGILMGLALKDQGIDKHIHLFDSFEGLPEPDAVYDKGYKKGIFKSDYDALMHAIEAQGLQETITVHRGWFKDTVAPFLAADSNDIALLHIDCDLYNSTNDCFPQLYPRVCAGGGVVLDDFNDGGRGEKIAILEYFEGCSPLVHIGPAPQATFIKGEPVAAHQATVEDAGFAYGFKRLLDDTHYLAWLDEMTQTHYADELATFFPRS